MRIILMEGERIIDDKIEYCEKKLKVTMEMISRENVFYVSI